jgi:glycerate 2-kinase
LHLIKNFSELVENSVTPEDKKARFLALSMIEAAIREANPKTAIENHVKIENNAKLLVDSISFNLKDFNHIFVVGGGKATGLMAQELEKILKDHITTGIITVLKSTEHEFQTSSIEVIGASHPIPDNEGVKGCEKIFNLLKDGEKEDLVIALISGGGSALLPFPANNIKLEEIQKVASLLLKSGANIGEVNTVRKHLSQIKGGQLAKAAYPATVISLIISDVVGDPLEAIASGPTAPDTTTFKEAQMILKKYNLLKDLPETALNHIRKGLEGIIPETPKPEDPIFKQVYNVIVANNAQACEAAAKKAKEEGLKAIIWTTKMQGEAKIIGSTIGKAAREKTINSQTFSPPYALIFGGETTVTVKGKGLGGRNQELTLAASKEIQDLKAISIVSCGTDGIDGPTDAAGAIVDGKTVEKALENALNPESYLENNDAYNFFKNLKDLIMTGPTKTNVTDVAILIDIS